MGVPKALLLMRGETFHSRACRACRDAGVGLIVVVNATVDHDLGQSMPGEHRVLNHDPDHESGMFGSVKLGVGEALNKGGNGAILLPVDHPLITGGDVRPVVERLENGARIAIATYEGHRGHPIGIDRATMLEILSDTSLMTLRDVVRRDPARVVEVPTSESALLGVNTKEDLEEVSNRSFR
jgi:CTP:molybdopterin cytidylyltransferase MocA